VLKSARRGETQQAITARNGAQSCIPYREEERSSQVIMKPIMGAALSEKNAPKTRRFTIKRVDSVSVGAE